VSERTELDLAFILTHNRPEHLRRCVRAIAPQVDRICVIDNASNPPITVEDLPPHQVHTLITDYEQPPNLARLMNVGFEWADREAVEWSYEMWNVAVLCDDVIVPEGWFTAVRHALRNTSAVAGSTHQSRPVELPILKRLFDQDIHNRMQGSAFVIKGEVGLRADEDMRWWWQDTDLDWQARKVGGMIIAPGPVALNERPNDFTYSVPGLAEQAGRDGETFRKKWGFKPW
jgi:glycosyltransferase involved in cell wall biosynthesis